MKKQYKIKYENGAIKPLEPIDLEGIQEGFVIFLDLDDPAKANKSSKADSLLKYAGTWAGDDLEECLKEVYESRGKAEF